MCGRYHIDPELAIEVQEILGKNVKKLRFNEKDIFPGSKGLILMPGNESIVPKEITWGFPGKEKNRLIINARSESALQKPMFSESLERRRCIIPARSFYEWDKEKNKVTFSRNDATAIYLAGIYNRFKDEDRFTILTTAANESVCDVHERMPVVIEKDAISDWLFSFERAPKLLQQPMPLFSSKKDYEQLSFNL
ncbi:SOS response-associated peptidase [Butyrivibrio sp. WCD3002]|jgi:putative SOS response-associated peptidase YedK|uniref:SOS response-associated peptidase n=1 Tax=Butyrivibrio sp. WCD3002 TaxID=1280676 RepID=UPI0003FF652C|nr:SOS response-associated peptidase [Butyrivibrio sp. WCD3002]